MTTDGDRKAWPQDDRSPGRHEIRAALEAAPSSMSTCLPSGYASIRVNASATVGSISSTKGNSFGRFAR